MRALCFILLGLIFFQYSFSQTLIATTSDPNATANHNQRKIIRDYDGKIFVVYTDIIDGISVIKGIVKDEDWGEPFTIVEGKNPTLSFANEKHLIYESNDSISRICHMWSEGFMNWNGTQIISDTNFICKMPKAGKHYNQMIDFLYVKISDSNESVIYTCLNEDNNTEPTKREVIGSSIINDISIAPDLNEWSYSDIAFFTGIQFDNDSIAFYYKTYSDTILTHYRTIAGKHPAITFNSTNYFLTACMLYKNLEGNLIEYIPDLWNFEYDNFLNISQYMDNNSPIDMICIDDVIPEVGFSFLCLSNDTLKHFFINDWGLYRMDTITTNPINPSIAYRFFNPEYIDCIWMEENGDLYDIYYMRDEKYVYIHSIDDHIDLNASITAFPNPFSDVINIKIETESTVEPPLIKIYNLRSQLITTLSAKNNGDNKFSYSWDATNDAGEQVSPGVYILTSKIGNQMAVGKVVFE